MASNGEFDTSTAALAIGVERPERNASNVANTLESHTPKNEINGSENDKQSIENPSNEMLEKETIAYPDDSGPSDEQADPKDCASTAERDIESDAETSEGEHVNMLEEGWRRRYDNIKSRAKMMPKRAKQMYQYVAVMEERVGFLEQNIDDIMKHCKIRSKIADDTDDDDDEFPQRHIEFKLNHQLWNEFKSPVKEGSSIHVIDILVEEPQYLDEESFDLRERLSRRVLKHVGLDEDMPMSTRRPVQATAVELDDAVEGLRGNRLPERVRFNSVALLHILQKHFRSSASGGDGPVFPSGHIMLRPFKALLHFEEDIRDLWIDLKGILDKLRLSGLSENIGGEDPSEFEDAKSGCRQDPDQPIPINKDAWSYILKTLELFHSEEWSRRMASEWRTDHDVSKSFSCLFQLIDDYMKPITGRLRQRDADKVCFADLWLLFRCGDEIITKPTSRAANTMAMRVLTTTGGRRHIHPSTAPSFDATPLPDKIERLHPVNGINPFSIHAWYIDFDGISLTAVRRRFVIQPYVGERSITSLDVYPISYAKGVVELKASLIERGKNFVKFATSTTPSYCHCKGEDLDTREELNEKVIIDMNEYGKEHYLPEYSEPDALDMSETSTCELGLDCTMGPDCMHNTSRIIHDQYTEKRVMKDYISEQAILRNVSGNMQREELELRDEDYAICNYRLFAYKLRSREWAEVHVGGLEDATQTNDEKGFKRLVLPPDHKHIIKSQVIEHFRKKSMSKSAPQDDIDLVRGKGQGLIILLHGAPGVGKTCTAETIADLVHKPLYPITCGDLGSTAAEVEDNLKDHFTLASRWDCVMLLDEADVFLAKRRSEDLHRNSIVSVFLRIMEYYKGLLFLTTNRVGTFDEAFKSRVHISLFYADFDRETTIKVWETFIRQTKEAIKKKGWNNFKVKSKEICEFAGKHWEENEKARWNGRQIRNAFHTAVAMAEFDARAQGGGEEPSNIILGREQFEKIAKTVRAFDEYMVDVMGMGFDEVADKNKLRKYKHKPHTEDRKEEVKRKKSSKKSKNQKAQSSTDESESSTESDDRNKKTRSSGKKGKSKARNLHEDTDTDSPLSDSD